MWPTEANGAALRPLTRGTHPSGWLEVDVSRFRADVLSRELETATVLFDLSTTTDSFLVELFLGGNSVRAIGFSADEGLVAARQGGAIRGRGEVLEAFLGSEPKLLAAIALASRCSVAS